MKILVKYCRTSGCIDIKCCYSGATSKVELEKVTLFYSSVGGMRQLLRLLDFKRNEADEENENTLNFHFFSFSKKRFIRSKYYLVVTITGDKAATHEKD